MTLLCRRAVLTFDDSIATFKSSFSFLSSSSSSSRDSCASHCRMPHWRSASDLPLRPTSYILLPHLQGLHLSASNAGICSRCASCVSFQISSLTVPSAMALTWSVSALSSRSFSRLTLYLASLYACTLSTYSCNWLSKLCCAFFLASCGLTNASNDLNIHPPFMPILY